MLGYLPPSGEGGVRALTRSLSLSLSLTLSLYLTLSMPVPCKTNKKAAERQP